jgi:hypothetical protein
LKITYLFSSELPVSGNGDVEVIGYLMSVLSAARSLGCKEGTLSKNHDSAKVKLQRNLKSLDMKGRSPR